MSKFKKRLSAGVVFVSWAKVVHSSYLAVAKRKTKICYQQVWQFGVSMGLVPRLFARFFHLKRPENAPTETICREVHFRHGVQAGPFLAPHRTAREKACSRKKKRFVFRKERSISHTKSSSSQLAFLAFITYQALRDCPTW